MINVSYLLFLFNFALFSNFSRAFLGVRLCKQSCYIFKKKVSLQREPEVQPLKRKR